MDHDIIIVHRARIGAHDGDGHDSLRTAGAKGLHEVSGTSGGGNPDKDISGTALCFDLAGKEAVVIGRSRILGRPAAMLLLRENATVTIAHSRTVGLPEIVRRADIVVACVGKPEFVKADWIKDGAVLIDAGYNPGNVGDIDLKNAAAKSSAYTPVPGGVGPMTICMLMEQTVEAAEANARA